LLFSFIRFSLKLGAIVAFVQDLPCTFTASSYAFRLQEH